MSIRKKKELYDFGDIKPITLMNMSREDLLDVIQMQTNNYKSLKQRCDVIQARLLKCDEYLRKQGLTDKEINKIIELECERY